uniref:RE1-silencing transcription factor n=1 Tax=Anthurium amnicola TaxID=1678845 RepID=A0A1D1XQW3_9ARAE
MNREATEGGLLPVNPEIIKSGGDARNITGKAATGALLSVSRDDGKISPHYLRASVGSCHDFCKYGRKHSFKSRGKYHTFPIFAGISTAPKKEQNRVKIPSLVERQKKSAVKQKASAHLETRSCDRHKICEKVFLSPEKTIEPVKEFEINQITLFLEKTGLSEESEVTECNFLSPFEKIESACEFDFIEQGTPERTVLYDDPETIIQEISPLLMSSDASGNSEAANSKKPFKKIDLSSEPASTEQRTGTSIKSFSSCKPKIMQKVPSPVKKAISTGISKVSKQETPSPAKRFDASATPAVSGRLRVTSLKSTSPLHPTTGTSRKGESTRVKNASLSVPGEKKTVIPVSASLSSQSPLNQASNFTMRKFKITKSSSAVKQPKKVEKTDRVHDKIKEKTLYVIEPQSAVDKNFAAGKSRRRVAVVHPEDTDTTPYKLKFRRGKVVNPQSVNDDPRRLRFGEGRRMGSNHGGKGGLGKRSFKSKELACKDFNCPCPEVQIVVLKHQDVQDKKDSQGLFNDVIEETASKLVETRKSKVKALVGAFETVISLLESKPAALV